MRKQHIAAVFSEVFCLCLLTWKYYLIHPFLTDVNIIFLQILWPIDWCARSMYTAHLILLSEIFWAAVDHYDVCSFWCFCIMSQSPTHFPGTCPRLFIDGHNTQIHCIKKKMAWQKTSLLNFGLRRGHFWSVCSCQPTFLCQHRAGILTFCSKLSQQCTKDFTIMV